MTEPRGSEEHHAGKCATEISGVDDAFEDGCDKEKEQDELRKQEEVANAHGVLLSNCDISYELL